ncbi:MAG: hypothetical protein LBD24_00890 [Spirochaetaceae bacterium]|jgi:hypothetical protein|nr:hypothetical protein [Spirochaetaceae bacterium]
MKEQDFLKAATPEARAAITRLRELLGAQRDTLRTCLSALAKQKEKIEQNQGEDALFHAELLEQAMRDILAVQKVIQPLMARFPCRTEPEIRAITRNIRDIQEEVRARARENTELLGKRRAFLAAEIQKIQKNPLRKRMSPHAPPSMIDMEI